jgi:hypothetical protein
LWAGQQEVGRLGLTSFIDNPISDITFEGLVKLYIDSGAIGQKTLSQRKASGTVAVLQHNLETHCMPRWRDTPVCKIETEPVEDWLLSLHEEKKLAWPTINKVKHAMQGAFKFGRKKKFLPADFDPFKDINCEASSDYEAITCTPRPLRFLISWTSRSSFWLWLSLQRD